MTITYTGLLAITMGIVSAIILFVIASIWACFLYLEKKEKKSYEKDDKFEYLKIDTYSGVNFEELGQQGWELAGIDDFTAYFKRPLKDKKS